MGPDTGARPPETRYAFTPDGVSLAYHVVGDGPVDLLWIHAFMGGLEVMWEHEVMRDLTARLTRFARVIRHDMRATGLSSRAATLPDLETQVQDALTVLDAVGSRSTVIVGAGPGAHAALLFGATFPARARALCLWDLYAWTDSAFQERDLELLTRNWGSEASAGAAMADVAPSLVGDRDFIRWYAKLQRHFVPPDVAAELVRSARQIDVRPLLPAVHVPTLVLARNWPENELDRQMAEQIDGARFQLLPGTERASFAGNQDDLVDAIRSFIGVEGATAPPQTLLRAVLFTDIVGSTEHLTRVGDEAWRALLAAHDAMARQAVEGQAGRIIKSTGDGILATFEGPAHAVRAALAFETEVRQLGIEVRAGVHVGEIEVTADDVMGVTVHVAARVAAAAGASEVLVSETVKDLVAGSGLSFVDVGEHELKGVPGTRRLYRVTTGPSTARR